MAEPQAPLKTSPARGWSAYQWGIVLLLLFGLVLSAIDKVNLAVTGPYWIKHHLFTAPQVGLLQAILGWSLTFFLLIAGRRQLGRRVCAPHHRPFAGQDAFV